MSSAEPPAPANEPGTGVVDGAEEAEGETEPEAPANQAQHELLAELRSELGDAIVGSHVDHDDLWVRVRASDWLRTAEACHGLGFRYFCFLSAIDWMPHTWPNPKVSTGEGEGEGEGDEEPAEPEPAVQAADGHTPDGQWATGVAGGDTRFQVLARFYSVTRHLGVTLKADLDSTEPRVDSIALVYPGADWHERETWEMYGFDFVGHPYLAHLYLPSEFEGFPLRKDFPLLSREVKPWPGLVDVEPFPAGTDSEPAPGDDTESSGEAG